jgi:photosystem II stability/assembly factor-like uncharacterized protein
LAAAQALPEGEVRNRAVRDAEFLVKDGPDKPLFDVDFRNAKEGLVVGAYGMALATADGGVSWRAVGAQIPNGKGRHLMRISRLGARTWITGEQASLFTAGSDGVYAEVAVPYNGTLFGLLPLSDSSWLAYGLRGNAFLSQDEGRNWVKVSLPEPVTLTHALKATSGLLLVDQSGRLLGSADAVAFTPRNSAPLAPINAAAEAADQALVLATVRGMVRIEPVQRLAGKS